MAKKRSKKQKPKDNSTDKIKLAIRAVAVVLLIGVLIVAVLDFQEKRRFQSTFDAVAVRIADEGFSVDELPQLIQGSPSVNGSVETDSTVVYRWGVIRSYDMTLTIQGAPERAVVHAE